MNKLIKQTSCILLALLVMLSGIPSAVLSYAQKTEHDTIKLSASLDDVDVFVEAEQGAFPDGVSLSVEPVSVHEQDRVDRAVESERAEDVNVAKSHTFDITVLDSDGNEVQPAEGKSVEVSFRSDTVSDDNLDTQVYHIQKDENSALSAEPLDVVSEGDTATVETDGFSYYTVEFTYGDKQYVLPGGTTVPLSEVLEQVGLTGKVINAESEDAPIRIYQEDGEWFVSAVQAFDTTHNMKVTISNIEYGVEIVNDYNFIVTDSGGGGTFAADQDIATFKIDLDKITTSNDTFFQVDGQTSGNFPSEWSYDANNKYLKYDATLTPNTVLSLNNTVTLIAKNAAVDSSRNNQYDVRIEYTNIKLYPNTEATSSYTTNATLFVKNSSSTLTPAGITSGFPTINPQSTSWNNRFGFTCDVKIYVTDRRGSSVAQTGGTFIYTFADINIIPSYPYAYEGANNNGFRESVKINEGTPSYADTTPFDPADLSDTSKGGLTSDGTYVANGRGVFGSGIAGTIATTGVTAHITNRAMGSATNEWIMPDGITHTSTSSSGNYGKIELWTDGKTDKTESTGKQLYGGRYEPASGSVAEVRERRTYDIADGKVVQYKLTPEDGFILDAVDFSGSGGTLKAYYEDGHIDSGTDAAGTTYTESKIDYYIYEVPGTQIDDYTIHVKWKPAISLTANKAWEDDSNAWGLRPDSGIKFTLNGAGSGMQDTSNIEVFKDATSNNTGREWSHVWYNLPKYTGYASVTNTGTGIIKYTVSESITDATAAKYYSQVTPHKLTKTDTNKKPKWIVDKDSDTFNHRQYNNNQTTHPNFTEENKSWVTAGYDMREVKYTITNQFETTDVWVEKDAYPNYESGDSFAFEIEITNMDIAVAPTGWSERTPGTAGVYTNTLTIPTSDNKYKDVFKDIPEGTTYKIAEKSFAPDGKWKLVSVDNGTSGTIGTGTNAWSTTDHKKVFFGSAGNYKYYADNDPCHHNELTYNLPKLPTMTGYPKFYDYLGFETSDGSGTQHKDDGKSIDKREYPSVAKWPEHEVNYATSYSEGSCPNPMGHSHEHKYIVQKGTDSTGDWVFTVPENDGDVHAKAAHYHYFKNIRLADLTIGKMVDGNQASQDKYFKFTVNISNVDTNVKYLTLDMTDCDSNFKGGHSIEGNAATKYTSNEMNDANGLDVETTGIKYEALDYEVIMGKNTTNEIKIPGDAAQEIKVAAGGTASFDVYLQHGQKVKIKGLPVDAQYTVTEDEEDYKPYVEAVSDNDKKDDYTLDALDETTCPRKRSVGNKLSKTNSNKITDTNITKDAEVIFTNKRGGIIPTEVRVPMVLGGLVLFLSSLLWFLIRRKRNREFEYED